MEPAYRGVLASLIAILALGTGCGGGGVDTASPVPPLSLPREACAGAYDQGYTDRQSYRAGDSVTAYLHGLQDLRSCRLAVYDIQGKLAFSVAAPLFAQTAPAVDASVNGYAWRATLSFKLPTDLPSGVYMIEGKSPFVVRHGGMPDVLVVYPTNTANAYEQSGGKSLYTTPGHPGAVSFLRPIALAPRSEHCLRFFAALRGPRVGYAADVDLDDYATVADSKLLVITGHSEYWTRSARRTFDRFVDGGGHALVLSGNTMWWQVRYSADRTQLLCYKEGGDPEPDPLLQTRTWNSTSLGYPIVDSLGAEFPRGGYGRKADSGWDGYKIAAPDSPLLEGTGLRRGDILRVPTSEYDGARTRGFDAAGYPILDRAHPSFERMELIGFDRGSRFGIETIGTFIALQRHATSGTIVNVASNDWCSANGMGGRDGARIERITRNAVDLLLERRSAFSDTSGN